MTIQTRIMIDLAVSGLGNVNRLDEVVKERDNVKEFECWFGRDEIPKCWRVVTKFFPCNGIDRIVGNNDTSFDWGGNGYNAFYLVRVFFSIKKGCDASLGMTDKMKTFDLIPLMM
ncbi:hypothetical protein Klosneuvirus_3_267 [Klosneuvirus KNV1]|uniref:Uncharacterized protein n=1 Tax=Klosneuvirus KNV1 TaxID=1977640 RepID=A0A1V0SK91_9VIRU|nr:hypothetical protein Klosneuvirus_3_267 [Klosneuvirus KNV1]